MAKFQFSPDSLRRGFAIAKQVKPVTGDFVLKFVSGVLVIYSADKRRRCRAEIRPSDDHQDFTSDDYYLPADRSALFETDLEKVSISVSDKGMVIKSEGGGQSRQATVKKRLDNSRRAGVPARTDFEFVEVPTKSFEELLRQVSCSALVKETKTDEDRKVNQVHFYPDESTAMSNARFYASVVSMDGLALDLSVVADDIPLLRSFCSKVAGGSVHVGQTDRELLVSDPGSGTSMAFSRVAFSGGKRPPLQVLPEDGFTVEISVGSTALSKALTWCTMALEGTTRLTVEARPDDTGDIYLVLSTNGQELSRVPARFITGSDMKADFPAAIMANLCGAVDSDDTVLRYRHRASPTILEIRASKPPSSVSARHFVQCMKDRT